MKVMLLQPYLAPYRVDLFNTISESAQVSSLFLMYYSNYDSRRRWVFDKEKRFEELFVLPICKKIPDILKFCRYIRKIRPNVIVGFPNFFGLFALLLSWIYHFKIVAWSETTKIVDDDHKTSKLKKKVRGLYFRRSSAILVPGVLAKQYLQKLYRLPDDLFYFMPNTVDEKYSLSCDAVKEKFSGGKTFKLLFSGNLLPYKGIDVLCSVFQENISLYRGKITLEILGAGPISVPPSECVSVRGFLNGEDYVSALQSAHIFILPSRHDCNPLVVIEALKAGCVLLLSDAVGNYPEAVVDNGIVFRHNSKESLKEALDSVISLPQEKLLEMALASRKLGESFTHANSAKVFVRAVSSVCKDEENEK